MIKIVVLPALGTNCAKLQILLEDVVFATINVNETLGIINLKVDINDGDSHTFRRNLK